MAKTELRKGLDELETVLKAHNKFKQAQANQAFSFAAPSMSRGNPKSDELTHLARNPRLLLCVQLLRASLVAGGPEKEEAAVDAMRSDGCLLLLLRLVSLAGNQLLDAFPPAVGRLPTSLGDGGGGLFGGAPKQYVDFPGSSFDPSNSGAMQTWQTWRSSPLPSTMRINFMTLRGWLRQVKP